METRTLTLPDHPEFAARVAEIAVHAERVDGVAPLSEQFLLGITDARLGHRHHLALVDGRPVGVAAIEGESAELVVDPAHRGRGIGTTLLGQVGGVDVWAHGDLPAARALAGGQKRRVTRRLLVMAVDGAALTTAARFEEPVGLTAGNLADSVSRFGREGVEQAWLTVNNDAFSWHPEQGGWDRARLRRAGEAEWFSEEDVLFLWDGGVGGGELPPLAGFHWTKWHTEEDPAFGEVYVVGLSSDYRGRGLGDPLLRLGIAHLVAKGADRVILYVEADNEPAVRTYENLGFTVAEEHAVYSI